MHLRHLDWMHAIIMLYAGIWLPTSATDFSCISTPHSWPGTSIRVTSRLNLHLQGLPTALYRHDALFLVCLPYPAALSAGTNAKTSSRACRHLHIYDGCHTCVGCITDHNAQQIVQPSAVMSHTTHLRNANRLYVTGSVKPHEARGSHLALLRSFLGKSFQ